MTCTEFMGGLSHALAEHRLAQPPQHGTEVSTSERKGRAKRKHARYLGATQETQIAHCEIGNLKFLVLQHFRVGSEL